MQLIYVQLINRMVNGNQVHSTDRKSMQCLQEELEQSSAVPLRLATASSIPNFQLQDLESIKTDIDLSYTNSPTAFESLSTSSYVTVTVNHAHSFLQATYLFPCLYVFSPRLQKLLVSQVKCLADGQCYLFCLESTDKLQIIFLVTSSAVFRQAVCLLSHI